MPRPSLVTSSGPSPVRGFIAAILPSPSSRPHARRHGKALHRREAPHPQALRTPQSRAPSAEPASHNRFYLSPYYPVFGSRMVMIGHARCRPGARSDPFCRRYSADRSAPAVQRRPFRHCAGASRDRERRACAVGPRCAPARVREEVTFGGKRRAAGPRVDRSGSAAAVTRPAPAGSRGAGIGARHPADHGGGAVPGVPADPFVPRRRPGVAGPALPADRERCWADRSEMPNANAIFQRSSRVSVSCGAARPSRAHT